MSARKYRVVLSLDGEHTSRDVELESQNAVVDLLNWTDDTYAFRATLLKVYWLRDDGVEEQIYKR